MQPIKPRTICSEMFICDVYVTICIYKLWNAVSCSKWKNWRQQDNSVDVVLLSNSSSISNFLLFLSHSHFLLSSWPILTWICLFWVCRWVIFWLTFHCAQWLNCYHPPFHHLWWLLRRFLRCEALARHCDWEYVWFRAPWDATEQGSYVSNCVDPLVSMSNNYLMHAHKILISNLDLSTVPYF